jgi:hypothetical protein
MNQSARTGVPVFADTTARDAGFGGSGEKTLAEGQLCYLESTNVVQYYDGAAWATVGPTTAGVVQVKSTTKTDTFTTTSTSLVDITGLSVSITPTNASNKVLVFVNLSMSAGGAADPPFAILRDTTQIALGDTAGSRNRRTSGASNSSNNGIQGVSAQFLDSPATTSATTYKVQTQQISGQATTCINRSVTDTDSTSYSRLISTITVMEVTP